MGLKDLLKKFAVSNARTVRYQPISDGSAESKSRLCFSACVYAYDYQQTVQH